MTMDKQNLADDVKAFMTMGGLSVGEYNPRQAALYIGLQLEQMAEKLRAISAVNMIPHRSQLDLLILQLSSLSEIFKQGDYNLVVMEANLEELVDADIDLAWVSLGAAYSFARDVPGAMGEVSRANFDKFPNGEAVRDENGKIRKPEGWRPPDLKPFLP